MTDPIYCYYHRHARLEIIQRHGQTYAVCPECRRIDDCRASATS